MSSNVPTRRLPCPRYTRRSSIAAAIWTSLSSSAAPWRATAMPSARSCETHNRRLYRIARGVVRNDGEAEDIVQEAYVSAFTPPRQLPRRLRAYHLALAHRHQRGARTPAQEAAWRRIAPRPADRARRAEIIPFPLNASYDDPERTMAQRQILQLVERATDSLPDIYRTVFVARRDRGPEHRGDGGPARHTARDRQDPAASRSRPRAQAARRADRPGPARRLPVRRAGAATASPRPS